MGNIRDSRQFVEASQIRQISEQRSITKVFQSLQEANAGGLIIEAAGKLGAHYVDGKALADAIVSLTNARGADWLRSQSISNIIHEPEIGKAIVKVDESALRGDETLVGLQHGPISPVREENRTIGWYFSDEQLIKSFKTNPPKFLCKNNHENPDPDHGTCYQCPAEIIGAR